MSQPQDRRDHVDAPHPAPSRHPRWTRTAAGLLIAAALAFGLASRVHADAAPLRFQAVFLKKVLQYDRALTGKRMSVLVIDPKADEVVKALTAVGLEATGFAQPPANIEQLDFTVLLLAESSAATKALCARKQILSASFNPDLAASGEVSVALRKRDVGPPEIIVNLRRMREEAHSLSADLLGMVTVIR